MANTTVKSDLKITFEITLELSLAEARALNEMVKYSVDDFLAGYYKHLGKSYLQPHANGVRSLFTTVRENLPGKLHNVDKMIKAINELPNLNK